MAANRLRIDYVPVDSIKVHPENPRRGNVEVIEESISRNGVYQPVVAQRSTGHIIVGNHRYLAMRAQGLKEIPVIWRDLSDEDVLRIMLVDNRSSELGEFDLEQLVGILDDLQGDLVGTGYTEDSLDDLTAYLEATRLSDLVPETPGQAEEADQGVGSVIIREGQAELVVVYEQGAREGLYAALHALPYVVNVRDKASL